MGPTGPRAGRVLYRVIPPGLCAGRVLYRHRPRVRYKVLPAWLVIGVSVKRFSLRAESGPKSAFLCVWGEFCTGWACRGCQWGEFCAGGGLRGVVLGIVASGGVWVFRTVCFERVVLSSPGCLWPGRMDDHEEVLEAHA